MQIESINKNLINFLFGSPTSSLKLQNLELKMYFKAGKGWGGLTGASWVCKFMGAFAEGHSPGLVQSHKICMRCDLWVIFKVIPRNY